MAENEGDIPDWCMKFLEELTPGVTMAEAAEAAGVLLEDVLDFRNAHDGFREHMDRLQNSFLNDRTGVRQYVSVERDWRHWDEGDERGIRWRRRGNDEPVKYSEAEIAAFNRRSKEDLEEMRDRVVAAGYCRLHFRYSTECTCGILRR